MKVSIMHTLHASLVTLLILSATLLPLHAEFTQCNKEKISSNLKQHYYDPTIVTVHDIQSAIKNCPACMYKDVINWTKNDLEACQKALHKKMDCPVEVHIDGVLRMTVQGLVVDTNYSVDVYKDKIHSSKYYLEACQETLRKQGVRTFVDERRYWNYHFASILVKEMFGKNSSCNEGSKSN